MDQSVGQWSKAVDAITLGYDRHWATTGRPLPRPRPAEQLSGHLVALDGPERGKLVVICRSLLMIEPLPVADRKVPVAEIAERAKS